MVVSKRTAGCQWMMCGLITAILSGGAGLSAYPQDSKSFQFEGPWAVTMYLGFEGAVLDIPIELLDRHRPCSLSQTFTVPETPLRVTLRQYLPDLVWRESAETKTDGGVLVRLTLQGPNLQQTLWLDSHDSQRRSISASIGSIGVVALEDSHTLGRIRQALAVSGTRLGLLRVWPLKEAPPLEIPLDLDHPEAIAIPGYTIKVLDYMSHYGIHMETGKVFDSPDKSDNPALKIEVDDGKTRQARWLWSRFPQFGQDGGHGQASHLLRAAFVDFERVRKVGYLALIVPPDGVAHVLSQQRERLRLDPAPVGQSHTFSDEAYTFTVEEILVGGALTKVWANRQDLLIQPALVVDIEGEDNSKEEVILEMGKPHHHRTSERTVTFYYGVKRPRQTAAP